MKHNKILAGLAIAGSVVAMSGAAHAISPAAAIALAAVSGAAVGTAAANATAPNVAVIPAAPPTVVMGAAPSQVSGHYESVNGVWTWVPGGTTVTVNTAAGINYDHDADGVLNQLDRFPNDASRS